MSEVPGPDWETLPRLLGEECDGPHGNRTEVYRLRLPLADLWMCQRCWMRTWRAAGGPPQTEVSHATTG